MRPDSGPRPVYSGGVMSKRTVVRLLVAVGVGLLFGTLTTVVAPIGLTAGPASAVVATGIGT